MFLFFINTCVKYCSKIGFQLTEHFIKQNNAIDIYQPYFTEPKCQDFQTLVPSYQTVAVIVDPCIPKRPIQNISWSTEQSSLIAVSYADKKFQMANLKNSPNSYVFDTGKEVCS